MPQRSSTAGEAKLREKGIKSNLYEQAVVKRRNGIVQTGLITDLYSTSSLQDASVHMIRRRLPFPRTRSFKPQFDLRSPAFIRSHFLLHRSYSRFEVAIVISPCRIFAHQKITHQKITGPFTRWVSSGGESTPLRSAGSPPSHGRDGGPSPRWRSCVVPSCHCRSAQNALSERDPF